MEERGSNNNVIQEGEEEQNQLDDLSEDLEKRYHELEEMTKGKTEEEVVQLKIHQLAVSKVLVFTYGKSDFKLVKAHAELGGAYLNYKCYEQAIDHLTMALKKNSKLNDSREAKEFNYRILTWLGKCYLEAGNVEDAIEILEKAYQEVIAIKGEDDIECAAIMTLLSNCNTQTKEYDIALDYLSKVWSIAEANYGFKSESCALVYVETAKVYIAKEDFVNAIDYQTRAINLMNELKTDKLEYLSELYKTLSNLQEKVNDTNGYLESHKKIRDIFMQLYGQTDKKTMKVKRHLALGLLKSGQNQEALQELLETEEMEVNFYGESSTQVAKTQKIIGTLLLLMKEYVEALKYFNKAMKIFNDNGAKNSVAEIKKKIQMIKEMKEKGELK